MKPLTLNEIDPQIRQKVYIQKYPETKFIDGIKIISLENYVGEEGDFSEILKINKEGEVSGITGFVLKQVNRTRLFPGSIKAWHLHLKQDELWYVLPSHHLLVGLWDVRSQSKTRGLTQRVVLGGGNSQLLYIPRGIAHGCVNLTKHYVEMFYFMNEIFNKSNPDESRIPWNALGENFWKPQRD